MSNEDLARLRVQFFRDAVRAIAQPDAARASPPPSPLLDALAHAVADFPRVQFRALDRLIDARDADLSYPNFATTHDLERFARATQGVLTQIHAETLVDPARPFPSDLVPLAASVGAAFGLAILLRAAPTHAASRLSYMPRDVVARHAVEANDLLVGADAARPVYRHVAETAEAHVRDAYGALAAVPKSLRPAFWPLRMAEWYLARLRNAQFNPFDLRLQLLVRSRYPLQLQLKLFFCKMVGA